MPTPAEYAASMRSTLAVTDPELDTSPGQTVRKIIDAAAEVAAEASVDRYLLQYSYDIDAKTGDDLEEFCRTMGGFNRIAARRASGSVVFERSAGATNPLVIPYGTQVGTSAEPLAVFFTLTPAVMQPSDTSIEVAVQAVLPGASGNVAANRIERSMQPIPGITSVTNPTPITGGSDAESDEALRKRFKRTFLRNMAGTEPMFLSVALDNEHVTQANVIGASKTRREQIEVVGGVATSTVEDAFSVYAGTSVFGSNIDAGNVLVPEVQYVFDHESIPPSITVIDEDNAPDGIYDLVFEYVPVASRNDPNIGITNCIDVYVDGRNPQPAEEVRSFSAASSFTMAESDPLYVGNFQRADGSAPETGNHFIPLALAPVLDPSVDDEIEVGATTYAEGVDYFLVNDVSDRGGSPRSLSGIEWVSTPNGATQPVPSDGTTFSVSYTYNTVPRDIEKALRDWRLVCFDAWVHQAKVLYLKLNLAIIFEVGFDENSVSTELEKNLSEYLSSVGFSGVVQVSDLYQAMHSVVGVDAVRFLTSSDDPTHYAIERVTPSGTPISVYQSAGRAIDIATNDDTVVALHSIRIETKAQNTFGAV